MNKLINWLKESHRYQHLFGGFIIGLGANSWYCAEYAGIGVAGALELKDKLYENNPDWIDFIITILGVNIGYLLRFLLL